MTQPQRVDAVRARRRARTAARARPGTPRRPRRRSSTSGATPTSSRPSRSCVSIGSSTTSSTPSTERAICAAMRDEPLADLGGGELQRGDAVGEPAPRRRVVVEALGVHQVLDRHAPADAAPDVPGVGGAARRRRAGASVAVVAADRLVGQRQRRRLADAAGDRRDVLDDLTGDQRGRRSPSRCAAGSRPGRARTPRRACPSGPRARSTPARRRSRASPRTAGCWCAPPSRRRSRSGTCTGPACA